MDRKIPSKCEATSRHIFLAFRIALSSQVFKIIRNTLQGVDFKNN